MNNKTNWLEAMRANKNISAPLKKSKKNKQEVATLTKKDLIPSVNVMEEFVT